MNKKAQFGLHSPFVLIGSIIIFVLMFPTIKEFLDGFFATSTSPLINLGVIGIPIIGFIAIIFFALSGGDL